MNPLRPNLKTEIVPIIFVLLSLVLSFYFYAYFPEVVATYWDFSGQANSYSSHAFSAFFFPLFNLVIYLLLLFIPRLDHKKENYPSFKYIYHIIKAALVIFLSAFYFLIGFSGLGYSLPIGPLVGLGIGLLFMIIEYYLKDIKPNWFLGIRTPWTLSSATVWQKSTILAAGYS